RDGVPYDADVVSVPKFAKVGVPDDFTIVMRTDQGEELVFEGSPIVTMPMTFFSPNDHLHGVSSDPDHNVCLLSPTRFRCGGVDGVGHLELSCLSQLR